VKALTDYNRNHFRELPQRNIVKFHLATAKGNVVTGLGPGLGAHRGDRIPGESGAHARSRRCRVRAFGLRRAVDREFEGLLKYKPEMVLLGTGASLRFPHPSLTRALTDAGVGLEVMDTPAACRTFNILAAEGRSVVAVLLIN
jgi:hypothetical protein